jgi:hypothetical protein
MFSFELVTFEGSEVWRQQQTRKCLLKAAFTRPLKVLEKSLKVLLKIFKGLETALKLPLKLFKGLETAFEGLLKNFQSLTFSRLRFATCYAGQQKGFNASSLALWGLWPSAF